MIVLKGILVVISFIVVPVVLGRMITGYMSERFRGHLLADWVFGIVLMFAQLQLMAVPMIIGDCAFHTLFYTYVALIVAELIAGLSKNLQCLLKEVKEIPLKLKKKGLLGLLVILSILMQGFMLCYFEHVDDDDARFVPSAVAAVEKDMMFEENPVTGEMMYSRVSEVFKDMVSPWIMFWAVISKVTMIHPAILMHSVVPLFFIPLVYAVYWILAGCLFGEEEKGDEKRLIFLGLISAIHLFSGYSVYNAGAFLLFRIWQGKALYAAIFVPIQVMLALELFQSERRGTWREYAVIAMTCCGACLTSGFGIILTAMFWGIISLIYAVAKKNLKGMVSLWIALIPCVIYGFLYAFGAKLFI